MRKSVLVTVVAALFPAGLRCQEQQTTQSRDTVRYKASQSALVVMQEIPGMDPETTAPAMRSMESHHLDMGPHMKMTMLRELKPGDQEQAQKVVEGAREAAEKYRDYHTALADGFNIFLPNVPQKMYHFTNYQYAFEAAFRFNPEHPTSLLYEKHGDDYKLVGVMYTAPKRFNEAKLDERIPLSIAQWDEHVNLCIPPADRKQEALGPKFGLHGSISTKEECDANGGSFHPLIFGWMVHVYPFEKSDAEIWAVDRGQQHSHMHAHNHDDQSRQ